MRISDWSSDVCSSDLKGETSIDIMNRTQGNPDYAVVKPWVQLPSNCVLPVSVLENWNTNQTYPYMLCPGVRGIINATSAPLIDPAKIGRASGRERVCQNV